MWQGLTAERALPLCQTHRAYVYAHVFGFRLRRNYSIWNDAEQATCELPLLSLLLRGQAISCVLESFADWTLFHAAERGSARCHSCPLPLVAPNLPFPEMYSSQSTFARGICPLQCMHTSERQHRSAALLGSTARQHCSAAPPGFTTRLHRSAAPLGSPAWQDRTAAPLGSTSRQHRPAALLGSTAQQHRSAAPLGSPAWQDRSAAPLGSTALEGNVSPVYAHMHSGPGHGSPRHPTGTEEMTPRGAGFHVFPCLGFMLSLFVHFVIILTWSPNAGTVVALPLDVCRCGCRQPFTVEMIFGPVRRIQYCMYGLLSRHAIRINDV